MSQKEKLRKKKFLRNKKSFIFITILCMGIGFAFLTSNLTITGNTSVSGNKWSVYFTNVQVNEASVEASVVPTTNGTSTTSINYTVTLDKPGDFYEFTVDAVNDGTIDAMIENINMTNLDSDVAKYLSYTATYLDGTTLTEKDVLEKNTLETYKIRVEYKKDVVASDLDETGINLTLYFEVKYVQSNVVPTNKFVDLIKDDALSDETINFTENATDTNGKGIFVVNDTKNDDNPIYYYRGNIENNNALFAGYCWKIVRTTDTGGVKLLYNGSPKNLYQSNIKLEESSYTNITNDSNYPYTFDNTNKFWTNNTIIKDSYASISFSVNVAGDYILQYEIGEQDNIYIRKGWDNIDIDNSKNTGTVSFYNLKPTDNISIYYEKKTEESSEINFSIGLGSEKKGISCNNVKEESGIDNASFNNPNNSLGKVGYMYGNNYAYNSISKTGNKVYGKSYTYENGAYTLVDYKTSYIPDADYHYTCLNTETQCNELAYIYLIYGNFLYYIKLKDGKSLDDEIAEMFENKNDSTIKGLIDEWFESTFLTYFTNLRKDYNNYLEDSIWCNDRSISRYGGWDPNGGTLDKTLVFGANSRLQNGTPILSCPNKKDSFTVNETTTGNGALTYPVGLLTTDEVVLAGDSYNKSSTSTTYLYTGQYWATMTPSHYGIVDAYVYSINPSDGNLYVGTVGNNYSIRPAISVSSNVGVKKGTTGTFSNPYEFIIQ